MRPLMRRSRGQVGGCAAALPAPASKGSKTSRPRAPVQPAPKRTRRVLKPSPAPPVAGTQFPGVSRRHPGPYLDLKPSSERALRSQVQALHARFRPAVSVSGRGEGTEPTACHPVWMPGPARNWPPPADRSRTSERGRASGREPGTAREPGCRAAGPPGRGRADATTPPPHPRSRPPPARRARDRPRPGTHPMSRPSPQLTDGRETPRTVKPPRGRTGQLPISSGRRPRSMRASPCKPSPLQKAEPFIASAHDRESQHERARRRAG